MTSRPSSFPRSKWSQIYLQKPKLSDSRKPLYIYQILIGTLYNVSDSLSNIFLPRGLFLREGFFARRFRQDSWREEIDIRSYSSTCRAVFVSVTGPGSSPPFPPALPLSPPCGTASSSLCPFALYTVCDAIVLFCRDFTARLMCRVRFWIGNFWVFEMLSMYSFLRLSICVKLLIVKLLGLTRFWTSRFLKYMILTERGSDTVGSMIL